MYVEMTVVDLFRAAAVLGRLFASKEQYPVASALRIARARKSVEDSAAHVLERMAVVCPGVLRDGLDGCRDEGERAVYMAVAGSVVDVDNGGLSAADVEAVAGEAVSVEEASVLLLLCGER